MTLYQRGRRLAIDVGSVRIGVASCDPDGILATPVETVRRSDDGSDLSRIAELVDEYEAVAVVVGRPVTLRGDVGAAAHTAAEFGRQLARQISPVPVIDFDERLTTTAASRAMRAAGRSARAQREVIDQAAAVQILQDWLDAKRAARSPSSGDVL